MTDHDGHQLDLDEAFAIYQQLAEEAAALQKRARRAYRRYLQLVDRGHEQQDAAGHRER